MIILVEDHPDHAELIIDKLEMKVADAKNIAQDEAIKMGGVDRVLPLEKIPNEVIKVCE